MPELPRHTLACSRSAILACARELLCAESQALAIMADGLGTEFFRAIELLFGCTGNVIVTGIGKAGLVGRKISATLASTGTPSHFLHASEALHGDLGRIRSGDSALVLSNSGETEEIVRLVPFLVNEAIPVVAMTSNPTSRLAREATLVLDIGVTNEAGPLGLAPSTSTTAMLALGDAISLVLSQLRGFSHEEFGKLHPGGSLGRRLSKVHEVMRPLSQCCVALDSWSLREIYVGAKRPPRRSGAILLVDECGRLTGIFTDSDLARLFEHKRDNAIDEPILHVMTPMPISVTLDVMLIDAINLLASKKISELPVVDDAGRPVGLIDITDVLGLLPNQPAERPDQPASLETILSPAAERARAA